MTEVHRVVIVGGGFGGLYTAQSLRRAPVQITVLDRRNFHVFQPLLYQVATAGLAPANITSPLRGILKPQRNARVLLAEVNDFDLAAPQVRLADGTTVPYDTLVVAAGAHPHYFGNDGWAPHAPSLKTVEDALEMRRRILFAFEAAERETVPERRRAWLNFVVIGAGPTGVELAGAVAELANDTLKHEFRAIDPTESNIVLVEGGPRVLPSYPPALSARAARSLRRLGVTVRTDTQVTAVDEDAVEMTSHGTNYRIGTRCVLWAAGVRTSPLADRLATRAGVTLDRGGRVPVAPDLSIPKHGSVFVIGDMAACPHHDTGEPLPGVAPVAMQQGRYVARLIRARLRGRNRPPFRYVNKGNLATIGRSAAVADFGPWLRFSGWLAWVLWLFVHLMFLIEFRNRVLVATQWAWSYLTRNRGNRLITGSSPPS